VVFAQSTNAFAYVAPSPPLVQMSVQAIAPAGGNQPHNNMMPYLTLNFNIALQGVFPPRP
jgi:microcystin-dependent protein